MKHIINVVALVLLVTVVVSNLLSNVDLLPIAASAEALPIDWLFGLHLQVIAFLFALIMVFMLYSVFVFRRKPGEEGDGEYFHGNTKLEIVWTIAPLVVVLYFGYLGAVTLADITAPAPDEMVVKVTGSQWSWRFDYPEEGISSTTLNLPQGRTILLKLTSTDVLHSFWVPEFRVKQDTVPGQVKELRITPTRIGSYKIRCAELCGLNHAYMLAEVNVLNPTEYAQWVSDETGAGAVAGGDTVAQGAKVVELNGCSSCHSIDGSAGPGPSWLGTYGSERTFTDGTTLTADDDYLRQSILEPGAHVVEGFANIMPPTFADTLSDDDVEALIDYIESLGAQ